MFAEAFVGEHSGFCAKTLEGPSDCAAGDMGSWPLGKALGRDAAREACRSRCRACARCRFVSWSLKHRECSWFYDCDLASLPNAPESFHTLQLARAKPLRTLVATTALGPVRLKHHTVVPWLRHQGSEARRPLRFVVADDESTQYILSSQRGEAFVKAVFRLICSRCLARRPRAGVGPSSTFLPLSKAATIVDIGANSGYYSLLAAAHGCQVLAFDPQPGCNVRFEAAVAASNFTRLQLVKRPVGPPALTSVPMWGCEVRWSPSDHRWRKKVRVRTTTVQKHLTLVSPSQSSTPAARLALVKIDTEGFEVSVLQSLLPLLASIDNLLVETSPGWWTNRHHLSRAAGAKLYASLMSAHGFARAVTSGGKVIRDATELQAYIEAFGADGYYGQEDVWLSRNVSLVRQLRSRLNL